MLEQCDAALIIGEPDEFLNRLDAAMLESLGGWHTHLGRVMYYDPLQINPREIMPVTCKHFRFAYQDEVRIAWLPPTPVPQLEPLEVVIGNLSDIAELQLPEPVKSLVA